MSASQTPERPDSPTRVSQLVAAIREGSLGTYGYVLLLGFKTFDPARVLQLVERGLPYRALEQFQRNLSLSLSQVTQIVQIAPSTLIRRRQKGRLTPDESDRLLRMTRLFAKAVELHEGDTSSARKWLSSPQTALGGGAPLDVAKSEVGAREVESLMDRLEHGVFS